MIIYYAGTTLFRAWLLEDVRNQPLDVTDVSAECFIKKSNDAETSLFHYTVTSGELQFFTESTEGENSLLRAWLELRVDELDISPGDYVFYAYLLFPQKQLLEHCHMLVLNSAETEVTP